jgi:hypothetical protein
MIQRVCAHVSPRFLNDKLLPFAIKLAEDPVPNIRFNFAKLVEQLYPQMADSNRRRCEEALRKMVETE